MGRLVKIDNRTDNNINSNEKKGRLVRVSDTPELELGYMIRDAKKRETSVPQPSSTTNNTARQQPRANSYVQGSGMSKLQQMEAQREERQQKTQNPARSAKAAQIVREAEARSPRARSVQKADTGTLNDRGSVQRARNGYDLGAVRVEDPTARDEAYRQEVKKTYGVEELPEGNGLRLAWDSLMGGLTQAGSQVVDTADFLAGLVAPKGEKRGMDDIKYWEKWYTKPKGETWGEETANILDNAQRRADENAAAWERERAMQAAAIGTTKLGVSADTLSHLGTEAAAALPQSVLAIMSGGTSIGAGAATAEGLAAKSGLALSARAEKLRQMAVNGIADMAKDPNFWGSFVQTVGSDYEEALSSGADQSHAALAAVIGSFINAAVEIGGETGDAGLQELARKGDQAGIVDWVKSSLNEGKEEVIQGIVSRLTNAAVFDKDAKMFGEGGIIDPATALEEFKGGFAVGAILGGGQMLANSAIDRMNANRMEDTIGNVRQTLGAEGQSTFDQMRTEGQDPSAAVEYTERFVDAYNKGKRNEAIPQAVEMTDAEAETRAAWNAGRVDALTREGARNKQNQATREAGAGVIRTEYTDSLDQKTISALDRAAKQLGVTVEFADEVAGGNANAEIQGNRITIEKWNRNPVRALFGHEITHRIQELSADSYAEYKAAAREAMGADFERLVGDYQRDALENGFEYSRAQAEDEVVADFAGDLLQKDGALERFIQSAQGKPTLLQRIAQVFRDLVNKLRGTEKAQAERALGKLEKAYREAAKAEKSGARSDDSGVKYSFARLNDTTIQEQAEAMERRGSSPGEIWETLGVARTMDGKGWRFEIDDSGMRLRTDAANIPNSATLGELVDAPELFEAYPQLKDVRFVFADLEDSERGYFSSGDNTIVLSEELRGAPEDTLVHEIQHVIQGMDKTPGGSSPGYWNRRMEEGFSRRENDGRIARAEKEYRRIFDNAPEPFKNRVREINRNRIAKDYDAAEAIVDELYDSEYADLWSQLEMADFERRSERGDELLPSDLYRNTAGEIEARDAASRRRMTSEERRATMPKVADENTVFAESSNNYFSMSTEEQAGIREQLREHQDELNEMQPVGKVNTRAYAGMDTRRARETLVSELKKTGYKVDRPGVGVIQFDESEINNSLNYKEKDPSAEAARRTGFLVLKDVLKRGIEISGHADHKGRGYETLTIAAPVEINGQRGNMAVVVKQTKGNRYKVHRILTPDGGTFSLPEMANAEMNTVGAFTNDSHSLGGSTPAITSASNVNVTETGENVKEKFSRKTTSALFNAYKDINQRLQAGEITQEQATQEKATALDRIYTGYVQSYGEMAPGENPARKVSVPKQTSDTTKVSQTIRTIMEAKATPESILPTLKESIANGDFDYETYTDAAAKADAEKTIRDVGWDKAQRKWFNAMENGIVTKENTALGWTLYNNAVNSGNTELAIDVLNQVVKSQRNAAQALQATRILKQLSPEGQLYQVQRSVADLQREINNRYRKDGAPKLEIDKDLAKKLMEAKDQNARDKVLEEIYKDIGRQMPSRFIDKWNAWRYLAMLGNPRTHVRNLFGNAGFMPVVGVKNLVAQGIETVASKVSPGMERTKGMFSAKLFKAAMADYANVEGAAMSGGKYSDFAAANKYVEEGRQIFGTSRWKFWNKTGGRALEALRKKNGAALDTEDVWFSKPHYANAMAQYCKANGITAEQIRSGDEKVLRKARAYAVQEAAKATYRDTNALSEAVSSIGGRWRSSDNKVKRVTGTLVEGILPFRKTPANILARGLEYSPAGLLKGLTNDLVQVKKGNMTAAQAIDNISAGLTGTGLLMLGGYLAAQGLLRGGGSGDDDKDKMDELSGRQDYSMEIGDTSVTLDWLAPEALPLFVGVNLYETWKANNGEMQLSDYLNAIKNVSEPMVEMSCLQSLDDVFNSVATARYSGKSALTAVLVSAATSYITQALPTILGQAERTSEPLRMTTYTSKGKFATTDVQYFLGKSSARIPVWDYQQIPYIDAWGRAESNGTTAERAFNNFVNPAYVSTIRQSDMEKEIERLYEATEDGGVVPDRADKSIKLQEGTKYLSAEEYVKYATEKGQKSYALAEELVNSAAYQAADDTRKADMIRYAYQYATAVAKTKVSDYALRGWQAKCAEVTKKTGLSEATYITLYLEQLDVEGYKDEDGDPIANSAGLQKMEVVYNMPGLTDAQRSALFGAFGVGKKVAHYNKAKVSQELGKLRSKAR